MKFMGRVESVLTLVTMTAGAMLFTMCVQKSIVDPENPGGETEVPVVPEKQDTLYVTGVEYPEGYDWVKDVEYGTVSCRLFLEKAGERIVEVPVGYSYETASDPDMHRCINGHLYTDFSSDEETVIKMDGATLFRYKGREMITSFHVADDGAVYTVGQPRSGEPGFTLRKNGQVLLDISEGHVLSGICAKGEDILVLYKVESGSSGITSSDSGYYLYDCGHSEKFADISDEEEIVSAAVIDGDISYVAVRDNGNARSGYFVCGADSYDIKTEKYGNLMYCEILQSGHEIRLAGWCRPGSSSSLRYVVWDRNGTVVYSLPSGSVRCCAVADGEDMYDFANPGSAVHGISCYKNGRMVHAYGNDVVYYGSTPAAICRGSLYFAFSDKEDGRKPCVAVDNEIKSFAFNGFFTGVSVW